MSTAAALLSTAAALSAIPGVTTAAASPVTPVHIPFYKRVEAKAEALFHRLPKWEVVASLALETTAPILEGILTVEDPPLEAVLAPVIQTVETKLAVAGTLIDGLEKSTSLEQALVGVQSDLGTILNLAEVKNSTSAAKVTQQVNLLISVVASIQAAAGFATPTAAPTSQP